MLCLGLPSTSTGMTLEVNHRLIRLIQLIHFLALLGSTGRRCSFHPSIKWSLLQRILQQSVTLIQHQNRQSIEQGLKTWAEGELVCKVIRACSAGWNRMRFEISQLQIVIGNSCKYSTSLTKRIGRIIETEHGLDWYIWAEEFITKYRPSWPLIALTLTHAATSPRLVPSKCSTNFDTVPTRMAGRRRRMAASSCSVPAGS